MDILTFGEILWDVFPDKSVIGGAPFNFSAHLVKQGADVALITAVGGDTLGVDARRCLREQGVKEDFVMESDYPTGVCIVTVDKNGTPSYDLRRDMAYDHIALSAEQKDTIRRASYRAFYFGTLAQRSEVSRQTVVSILSRCRFDHVLFDINIRQSYYSGPLIEQGLRACTILKTSREEVGVFEETGLVKTARKEFEKEPDYHQALCRELAHTYGIETILLTLDKDGAMVYSSKPDDFIYSEKPQGKVVATVGAGDSFSACYLYHYLNGESAEVCLHKAILLSDFVVQHTEAIPGYPKGLLDQLQA